MFGCLRSQTPLAANDVTWCLTIKMLDFKPFNIWSCVFSTEQWTKRAPSCLGYTGDYTTYPVMWRIISWTILRIPIKQPVFHGKYPAVVLRPWFNWGVLKACTICHLTWISSRPKIFELFFQEMVGFDIKELSPKMQETFMIISLMNIRPKLWMKQWRSSL